MRFTIFATTLFGVLAVQQAHAQAGLSLIGAAGGSSTSAFASAGLQAGLGFGVTKPFAVGLGARVTYAHSADRDLQAIDPSSENDGLSLRADKFNQANVALYVFTTLRLLPRLMVGANVDLVGLTVGSTTHATQNNLLGSRVDVSATSPSLLMGTKKDYGLLQSEFFLGYELFPSLWIRGGMSYQHVELKTSSKINGQERFGGFIPGWFVGVTLPLTKPLTN
jgi:hypothetical protein